MKIAKQWIFESYARADPDVRRPDYGHVEDRCRGTENGQSYDDDEGSRGWPTKKANSARPHCHSLR